MELFQSPKRDKTIGSDRLQKAIERNRAKQLKRSSTSTSRFSAPGPGRVKPGATPPRSPSFLNSAARSAPRASVARRSVGTQDNIELVGKRPAGASSISSKVRRVGTPTRSNFRSNTFSNTASKKFQKSPDSGGFFENFFGDRFRALCLKVLNVTGWLVCLVFLAHVTFGKRGIWEYRTRYSFFEDKNRLHERMIRDNQLLVGEIDKIQNNQAYQKKLIRDYLGYIEKSEYLVIFSENEVL